MFRKDGDLEGDAPASVNLDFRQPELPAGVETRGSYGWLPTQGVYLLGITRNWAIDAGSPALKMVVDHNRPGVIWSSNIELQEEGSDWVLAFDVHGADGNEETSSRYVNVTDTDGDRLFNTSFEVDADNWTHHEFCFGIDRDEHDAIALNIGASNVSSDYRAIIHFADFVVRPAEDGECDR